MNSKPRQRRPPHPGAGLMHVSGKDAALHRGSGTACNEAPEELHKHDCRESPEVRAQHLLQVVAPGLPMPDEEEQLPVCKQTADGSEAEQGAAQP